MSPQIFWLAEVFLLLFLFSLKRCSRPTGHRCSLNSRTPIGEQRGECGLARPGHKNRAVSDSDLPTTIPMQSLLLNLCVCPRMPPLPLSSSFFPLAQANIIHSGSGRNFRPGCKPSECKSGQETPRRPRKLRGGRSETLHSPRHPFQKGNQLRGEKRRRRRRGGKFTAESSSLSLLSSLTLKCSFIRLALSE